MDIIRLQQDIVLAIHHHYPESDFSSISVEYAREPTYGDIAFPCFPLAPLWKKSPQSIAEEIVDTVQFPEEVKQAQAVNGYVNLRLNPHYILSQSIQDTPPRDEKIALEFSSPNTNKPLHIGHMRNIALGESLTHIFRACGYQVVKTEVVNDRGIAMAKMMYIYDRFTKDELSVDDKLDHFSGKLYSQFESYVEEHPEAENAAQEILQKWEAGDPYWYDIWWKLRNWTIKGQQQTYERLQTSFDERVFESEMYQDGVEDVRRGLKNGVFYCHPEKNYIYASFEQEHLPEKILLRSNGTSLYITQDIALLNYRLYGDSACRGAQSLIYITDIAQNLQFQQLFAIMRQLGVEETSFHHLGYGRISKPEGKMSSRKGNVVLVDDLIDDLETLIRDTYFTNQSVLETEQHRRIQVIARAAYLWYMLFPSMKKDIIFDPQQSITLHGKTGPYILYTYARLKSILRKSQYESQYRQDYTYQEEHQMMVQIARASEVRDRACREMDPSIIAQYTYDLAEMINSYYHKIPILGQDKAVEQGRLYVIDQAQQTLKYMCQLLHMEVLEEM